jgi:DNA repair exonuclease SbcCD ATPase subunit
LLHDSLRDVRHASLRSLLARAFDLDAKRAEAEQLAALAGDLKASAEQLSREVRSEERAIGRLEVEVEAAVSDEAAADDALVHARDALEAARGARDAYLKAVAASQLVAKWDADASRVLDAVRQLVPTVTLDTIPGLVDELAGRVEAEAAAVQEQAAALRARVDLIDSALADLGAAGANCPVCRRPLGDQDRAAAEAGHRTEADHLREELGRLDLEAARDRVKEARALSRQVLALGERPEGPSISDLPPDPQDVYDDARAELERAVAAQQAAASKAEELDAALRSAREVAERSALSEQAWRRWALTSAASTALFKSIDDVIDMEVTPVRRAVTRRWNDLFRNRAGLEFDLDGNLWRLVNGERLPIEGFSAGEQTAARILMQLAILTTATAIDFCWFDEPLEHLDPRTRRHVAALLAQGRKATGLRQLVVTTYEEELAAQLADAEESARIEYVRAGPMDERIA